MKSLLKITLFLFLAFSLNACLEDEPINDYTQIQPIVIIPNGNWPASASISPKTLDFKPEPQNLDLYARVSYENPLKEDVTVTFQLDAKVIEDYNKKFGTAFTELPAAAYKLPNPFTVVIPAGQTTAQVAIQVFADKIDLSKPSMLAVRLTQAGNQTIASNKSVMVFPVAVKNAYHASYTVAGYFFHPSSPRAINASKDISTISSNRCQAELGDLGGAGYKFRFDVNGGNCENWESLEACPPAPAAGFMSEDNPAGIGTYPGPGGFTKDVYNNSYNAGSKKFFFHYGYGAGSSGQAGYTRQVYETWTRK